MFSLVLLVGWGTIGLVGWWGAVFPSTFSPAVSLGALAILLCLRWVWVLFNLVNIFGWQCWFQGLSEGMHFVLGLQPLCDKIYQLVSI